MTARHKRKARAPSALGAGPVRLQKLLAAAGFGSRRACEQLIEDGRVSVDGRTAKLGDAADPHAQKVALDGERLELGKPSYWLVNKPRGVLTTLRDPEGRRTVMSLVPRAAGRVFPVGRLDADTEGLLLMTNDGAMAHALLHPSLGNEREYVVVVKGALDANVRARLARGVHLEDGPTGPMRIASEHYDAKSETTRLRLVLREGRKRQIRRSLLALGHPVKRLERVRMGPLSLGRLERGAARPLRREEIERLREHCRSLALARDRRR